MKNVPSLETVYRDYRSKGVQFYYIYKALAHPGRNGFVTPFTLEERLMHVREAKRRLRSEIPWICDTMHNDLKSALGDAPNSEFVIDPQGRIVRSRKWSQPDQLRQDLVELVGPVDVPTKVSDLDMPPVDTPRPAKSGIVPRLKLPDSMRRLVVKRVLTDDQQSLYVKVTARAQENLFTWGTGKLYLGFFLDPLYKVHWNNQVEPLQFRLEGPDFVTITPGSACGPKVAEAADVDPREFLLDVTITSGARRQSPVVLSLEVQYVACDDAGTFCLPVSQRYRIYLQWDETIESRI